MYAFCVPHNVRDGGRRWHLDVGVMCIGASTPVHCFPAAVHDVSL